jgi:hypothetical protein
MEEKNTNEAQSDLNISSEDFLSFNLDNLKLTEENQDKKFNNSLKDTVHDSTISSSSKSSFTNSIKFDSQNPQFFCSEFSQDQNKIADRPVANFNLDINAPMFNPNVDSKSQPSTQVPKMLNYPKVSEAFQMLQNTQSTNFQLTKKAILTSLKNQKTTIILQKIIMEAKSDVIESIVNELKGEYRRIMNDKNGNYFCTDLFKICNQKQRIQILQELHQTLSDDAINNYASHPIQTLIEFSSSEEEYKLILYSFNDYNKLLLASLDPNGSYVIQKIIMRIPERFRPDFNLIFVSFISFVSTQKFGIVAVKKFISSTKNEQITAQILNTIRNNFMNLARDKYGNYLIQYLLEKWGKFPEGNEIKELIIKNFKILSQIKYSSFICESFIKIITEEEKMRLLQTLDLNEIKSQNNPYQIKIMNLLGIKINSDNNNNNINFFPNQMQMQLPLSLNNNYMQNNQNFNNSGNQNMNIYGNNQKRKRK